VYLAGFGTSDDEMGGACSTDVRNEKYNKILVGNMKSRDHSEDLGVAGRIILKRIFKK
jgi:hypothetical protein